MRASVRAPSRVLAWSFGFLTMLLPVLSWACMCRSPPFHPPDIRMPLSDAEEAVRLVVEAEAALAHDQPEYALRMLDQSRLVSLRYQKTWLDIASREALEVVRVDPRFTTESEPLRQRFERVVAVALLRVAPSRARLALAILRSQLRQELWSSYLRARIAEAQSLLGQKESAKRLLEELDHGDELPDIAARILLAQLRFPHARICATIGKTPLELGPCRPRTFPRSQWDVSLRLWLLPSGITC